MNLSEVINSRLNKLSKFFFVSGSWIFSIFGFHFFKFFKKYFPNIILKFLKKMILKICVPSILIVTLLKSTNTVKEKNAKRKGANRKKVEKVVTVEIERNGKSATSNPQLRYII